MVTGIHKESNCMNKPYFSKKAQTYLRRCESFPWKPLKLAERDSLFEDIDLHDKDVLDMGSGPGYYANFIVRNSNANVTCVDSSEEMLRQIDNKRINKICSSLENLNLNKDYDLILLLGTLEFLEFPYSIFEKIHSYAAKGAQIIIMFPEMSKRGLLYKLYHHLHGNKVTLFISTEVEAKLKDVGIKLISQKKVGLFNRVFLLTLDK